jgi:hypothetical protein
MSRLKPRPTNKEKEADRGAGRRISFPAGPKSPTRESQRWGDGAESPYSYRDDFSNFLDDVAWSARIIVL